MIFLNFRKHEQGWLSALFDFSVIDRAVVLIQSCVCQCPILLPRSMAPIFSSFVVLWIPDFSPQWVRRSGCPEICDSDGRNSQITRRWGFKAKLLCLVENVNENRCLNRNLLPFWEGSLPSSLKVFILYPGRNLSWWPRNRANSLAISSTSGASWQPEGGISGSHQHRELTKQPLHGQQWWVREAESRYGGQARDTCNLGILLF